MALTLKGYAGKILEVDLSRGTTSVAPLNEDAARGFIGAASLVEEQQLGERAGWAALALAVLLAALVAAGRGGVAAGATAAHGRHRAAAGPAFERGATRPEKDATRANGGRLWAVGGEAPAVPGRQTLGVGARVSLACQAVAPAGHRAASRPAFELGAAQPEKDATRAKGGRLWAVGGEAPGGPRGAPTLLGQNLAEAMPPEGGQALFGRAQAVARLVIGDCFGSGRIEGFSDRSFAGPTMAGGARLRSLRSAGALSLSRGCSSSTVLARGCARVSRGSPPGAGRQGRGGQGLTPNAPWRRQPVGDLSACEFCASPRSRLHSPLSFLSIMRPEEAPPQAAGPEAVRVGPAARRPAVGPTCLTGPDRGP